MNIVALFKVTQSGTAYLDIVACLKAVVLIDGPDVSKT